MNKYFDEKIIEKFYPEAEQLMLPGMLIWKLPDNKKHMMSEVCSNGEYFLTEKIDGAFYQFVRTDNFSYLFGRTVSKTTGLLTEKSENVPHIKEILSCLPADTVLIGEIYVPGGTSKDVVHIMGCLPTEAIKRQEKEGLIRYYIHDILYYDGINLMNEGAESRYNILAAIWKLHKLYRYNFLQLARKIDKNLEEENSRILKYGGEGSVLKKRDAIYTPGKRPAWSSIKFKQMDTIDLICTGLCAPTREYTGKELKEWEYWEIGYPSFYDCFEEDHCFGGWNHWEKVQGKFYEEYLLNCSGGKFTKDTYRFFMPVTKPYFFGWKTAIKIGAYNEDNELVELGTVSSGLTDEDKKEMTFLPERWLGKVVSLDCMSISHDSMTLRHPVFKCLRGDKNPKDCKILDIFS